MSYSPHAHVQPIKTFVWKPIAILGFLSTPIKFPIQKPYRNQVYRTSPTLTYSPYNLLHRNPPPFWIPYRYRSSSPYKSRIETEFVVKPPRSRFGGTNFCMETRRHFGFPIDRNQVPIQKTYRNHVCRVLRQPTLQFLIFLINLILYAIIQWCLRLINWKWLKDNNSIMNTNNLIWYLQLYL